MTFARRLLRRVAACALLAVLAWALLAIPEREPPTPPGAGRTPFAWNQDAFWESLEARFLEARGLEPAALERRIDDELGGLHRLLEDLPGAPRSPDDPLLGELETRLFELAPLVAAVPERRAAFSHLAAEARRSVKHLSRTWDLASPAARDRLHRLLYGARLAVESLLLQDVPATPGNALVRRHDVASATPAAALFGVPLHSGDILISRGGAPTSSLIARGNDHPGSYSHAALVHIDPATGAITILESLIEHGLVQSSLSGYLGDGKIRLMLLRPRPDLPVLAADPVAPHRAAEAMLAEARRRHVPYDFAMDHADPARLFCSEVVSWAYAQVGIRLWMGMSYLSSPTVTAWLGSVGVRHFETQEPADLEYDPQLEVVAEWSEHTRLLDAHLNDAVTDVMLERAPVGEPLPYTWWMLPFGRLAKAWSIALNAVGREGPVPEGMGATAALRAERFREDHGRHVAALRERAEAFAREHGYAPPYWELVRLARDVAPAP